MQTLFLYLAVCMPFKRSFISFYSEIFTFSKQGFNESRDLYNHSTLHELTALKLYSAILYVLRKLFPKNSKRNGD